MSTVGINIVANFQLVAHSWLVDPKGTKFDYISDAVDEINVAKLKATDKDNAYDESAFDSEKDKATFRQFVDSNESSRRFYM